MSYNWIEISRTPNTKSGIDDIVTYKVETPYGVADVIITPINFFGRTEWPDNWYQIRMDPQIKGMAGTTGGKEFKTRVEKLIEEDCKTPAQG